MIREPRDKTPAKSSKSRSFSEMTARLNKLQEELDSLFPSRTPVIAEALEATMEGVRLSLAGSAKPTESSVLSSVVDELGQVVARKLQDKVSVEDSFVMARKRGET